MSDRILYLGLLIINCVISALSQVLLKSVAGRQHKSFWHQYLNVRVIIAYILYAIVVVVNIYVMKFIPLTMAMPFSSALPFILGVLFGRMFFGEKIGLRKIIGSLLIVIGIIIAVIALY